MTPLAPATAFRRSYRRTRCYSLGVLAVAVPVAVLLAAAGRFPRAHPVVWVVVVLGACVLVGAAAGTAQQRQDARMRAWAAGHGWELHPVVRRTDPGYDWLPVDEPLATAVASDVVHGLHGDRVVVSYTLLWSTQVRLWTKHREVRHTRQVLALAAPFAGPPLTIEPRRHALCGRGTVVVGSDDFDSRFRVRCDDPAAALTLLRPWTLQRLLAVPTTGLRSVLPIWVTANLRPRLDDATVTYTDSWVVATWTAIPDVGPSRAALELLDDLADLVPDGTRAAR